MKDLLLTELATEAVCALSLQTSVLAKDWTVFLLVNIAGMKLLTFGQWPRIEKQVWLEFVTCKR